MLAGMSRPGINPPTPTIEAEVHIPGPDQFGPCPDCPTAHPVFAPTKTPAPRRGFSTRDPNQWPVQEYERERLLERIDREGATVGASIPAEIEVDGEAFPLKEFVFEIKRLETVPEDRMDEVAEAKKRLRRERLDRKTTLEEADITLAEGEALVDEIVGIDRALNALESLGPTDLEAEMQASKAADTKRWHAFLKDVLGDDTTDKRRGVR